MVCGLCSAPITLDFREPAGRQAASTVPMLLARPSAQTQVSRHATAAVIMLVNGLTRQGTANNGILSTVRDAPSPFAVYSVPFRRHEMTVVETIIAVLHCLSNGQRVGLSACVHACVCALNLVCASDQCTSETRDIVRHVGVAIIITSTNVR